MVSERSAQPFAFEDLRSLPSFDILRLLNLALGIGIGIFGDVSLGV